MRFVEPKRSVIPGRSGLPSSRYVGNSDQAMLNRIVRREGQRIVHRVRASQPSAGVQKVGALACSQCPCFSFSSRRVNDIRQVAQPRAACPLR